MPASPKRQRNQLRGRPEFSAARKSAQARSQELLAQSLDPESNYDHANPLASSSVSLSRCSGGNMRHPTPMRSMGNTRHKSTESMRSQTTTQENPAAGVTPTAPWRILAVSMLPDFRLAVTFCDGRNGMIDCAAVLTSTNPGIYAPLATPAFFAPVKRELGALTWPNGADLDPGRLHAELADRKSWSVPFYCSSPF